MRMQNKFILLALTLFAFNSIMLAELPNAKTIAAHIQTMRAIKAGKDNKTTSVPSESHCQTDSYVEVFPAFKPEIQFADNKKILDLVVNIIQQERNMAETHYAFYHAQKKEFLFLQDIIKEIINWLHIKAVGAEFEFLRTPGDKQFDIEEGLYDFMAKKFEQYDAHMNAFFDHATEMITLLLSTNLALFANRTFKGESSFYDYFLPSKSYAAINIDDLLRSFTDQFKFNQTYITQIIDLTKKEASITENGLLQQIFIPKDLVDQVAYLSKQGGLFPSEAKHTAATDYKHIEPGKAVLPIMTGKSLKEIEAIKKTLLPPQQDDFKELSSTERAAFNWKEQMEYFRKREQHNKQNAFKQPWYIMKESKISPLLELYQKHPQTLLDKLVVIEEQDECLGEIPGTSRAREQGCYSLDEAFDALQARLLITAKTLLNPESGIQIYRYTTIPPQTYEEYRKKLKTIIDEMMLDWIEQRRAEGGVGAQSTVPAEKLIKYIKQHSLEK